MCRLMKGCHEAILWNISNKKKFYVLYHFFLHILHYIFIVPSCTALESTHANHPAPFQPPSSSLCWSSFSILLIIVIQCMSMDPYIKWHFTIQGTFSLLAQIHFKHSFALGIKIFDVASGIFKKKSVLKFASSQYI